MTSSATTTTRRDQVRRSISTEAMVSPERKETGTRDFLSPAHYDDDAASLRSASDQESDSEDDEVLQGARSSLEIAEHDRLVLKEEEEREKLLTEGDSAGKGLRRIFSGSHSNGSRVKIGKRERRRQRKQERNAARRRRKANNNEEGELMYEMEEGGPHDDVSSASSSDSSDLDRRKIQSVLENKVRVSTFTFERHGANMHQERSSHPDPSTGYLGVSSSSTTGSST